MDKDYIIFFNTYDSNGLRTVKPYMNYLHNHDMYNEDEFISEQVCKPDELEVYFGEEPELLKKNEALLLTYSKNVPSYTSLFGLDKDFIPTLEEIELIRSTWVSSLESAEPILLNSKFFKEDYQFHYRKPKDKIKPHSSDEELKYCAIQKAAVMLHDFYCQNDPNYSQHVENRNNNLGSKTNVIDEIFERLSDNAVLDLERVKSLTTKNNSKISSSITDLLEKYCITHIDWLKKAQELSVLSSQANIDISLTREELLANKAMTPDGSTNLEKVYNLMHDKYEAALKAKAEAEEKARLEAERKKQEKYEADTKKFEEIKKTAKELGLRTTMQNDYPNKKFFIFTAEGDTQDSFAIAKCDGQGQFLEFNEEALVNYNTYIEELRKKLELAKQPSPEKKGITRIDEYGEDQIDWTSSKPNYVNEFKYEKNTPYPLRGRKQFCCWRTVWRPSGKKLTNERGVTILDADGNPQMLPLYDRNGNVVYDEKGNVVLDGKWTKVPVNPNVPFDPKKPTACHARTNDPRTWGTFDEACKAVRMYGYEGVGIMLGNSVIGIDVDHVIGADGRFTEEALDIIDTANSYTELSPSKTGLHILMFGEIPEGARNRYGNLEIYGPGRFFTLTGDVVEGVFRKISSKQEGTKNINQIYEKYIPERNLGESGNKVIGKITWEEDQPGDRMLTNEEIINKLIAQGERRKNQEYVKEYKTGKQIKNPLKGVNLEFELLQGRYENYFASQSDADYALCSKIWYYTYSKKQVDEIFRESGLMRDKWEEYRGHNIYGQITIERMVSEYKGGKYNPNYRANQNQSEIIKKKGWVMDE